MVALFPIKHQMVGRLGNEANDCHQFEATSYVQLCTVDRKIFAVKNFSPGEN